MRQTSDAWKSCNYGVIELNRGRIQATLSTKVHIHNQQWRLESKQELRGVFFACICLSVIIRNVVLATEKEWGIHVYINSNRLLTLKS